MSQSTAAPAGGYGGYQAPDAGYPALGGVPPVAGVAGLDQQVAGMNLGGQPQQATPGQAARPMTLNQLYPTDLINQPFNVSELDLPPPPIILLPNTSVTPSPDANCSPKYVRSTLNAVPTTHSLLGKSRTYINPFVTFLDHGYRWRCNMCNLTNDVPQAFDWDAASQRSTDRWGRYELNYSVVEFVVPQEYMVRPPQPLVYLFLFDVSYAAVSTGLLATSARTILDSLDGIPNADRRTRLGFIAVDSSLHYFLVPKDGEENGETTMLVSNQNSDSAIGLRPEVLGRSQPFYRFRPDPGPGDDGYAFDRGEMALFVDDDETTTTKIDEKQHKPRNSEPGTLQL
ncbi:Sec23/Sec24 trunk domain-containing protein [Colletotrichum sojae]|uniref:Sec23/Sec24 trunk domain-containing protein n=1 Tax=Colletotrichum sojae TaxID=2175907 RepID=A0A8H6ILR7_9PEZI|nr:Sec23/Sec24 trunk domain-containing protein [Colletotrichum sojae]